MIPGRGADSVRVQVLEGMTIDSAPPSPGSRAASGGMRVLHGVGGAEIGLDEKLLSTHIMFLGGIGTGKSTAIKHLVRILRDTAGPDDVFVIFDTKGDYFEDLQRSGDRVLGDPLVGGTAESVIWNVFADLLETDTSARVDHIHEIASTIFSTELERAGQNFYFQAAARDVFAAVLLDMSLEPGSFYSNADLRTRLELPAKDLQFLLSERRELAGTARYLAGTSAQSVVAVLQQTLSAAFSGAFRQPGSFSVREFIRAKRSRALFIEYDIAIGSRLLPVYRVLMDMAIKEALDIGRRRAAGSVYFILDEFALLPALSHIGDGINFGRGLGLKFIAGSQNVNQVLSAYGPQLGLSILSGFGTIFALRLFDSGSRDLVRQRFGVNRKQITTFAPVRSEGVQQTLVTGNVIEDWVLSSLDKGQCIVAPPAGAPFFFAFPR